MCSLMTSDVFIRLAFIQIFNGASRKNLAKIPESQNLYKM